MVIYIIEKTRNSLSKSIALKTFNKKTYNPNDVKNLRIDNCDQYMGTNIFALTSENNIYICESKSNKCSCIFKVKDCFDIYFVKIINSHSNFDLNTVKVLLYFKK